MNITIEYKISKYDSIAGTYHKLYNNKFLWLFYILMLDIIVTWPHTIKIFQSSPNSTFFIIESLVIILSSILFLILFSVICAILLNTKRNNPALSETQRYSIDKDKLIVESDSSRTEMKWNIFYKVIKTKKRIFLYKNHCQAYIIPRRVFKDPADFYQLTIDIDDYISKSKT